MKITKAKALLLSWIVAALVLLACYSGIWLLPASLITKPWWPPIAAIITMLCTFGLSFYALYKLINRAEAGVRTFDPGTNH